MSVILQIIVRALIAMGMTVLKQKYPGLSQDIREILEELFSHIDLADDKEVAVKTIKSKVKECSGVGCPTTTKPLS